MYRESLEDIRAKLEALGIKYTWCAFLNIPSDHRYATYFVSDTSFDGDDLMAQYYEYSVQVVFFYKTYCDDDDFAMEQAFEESVREFTPFSKKCGFDAENAQFYTVYKFSFREFF